MTAALGGTIKNLGYPVLSDYGHFRGVLEFHKSSRFTTAMAEEVRVHPFY